MADIRFFDLLGVTTPDEAAAKWPADRVQPDLGISLEGSDTGFPELMTYLQDSLRFSALRPGAEQPGMDPDAPIKVGLTAELHVTPGPLGPGIVLVQMPKIGFRLESTRDTPAHIFITRGPGGLEVAIHGLPLTIFLPPGLIMPRRTPEERKAAGAADMPDVRVAPAPPPEGPIEGFDSDHPDSLEVVLSDAGSTQIRVRTNVRMTELGDFYFDTVVPISIGECIFSGLPMKGLHDLQIIPNPAPDGVAAEHIHAELPFEWKRHRLDLLPGVVGMFSIRTLDLAMEEKPWRALAEKIRAKRKEADPVEFVLEDLALPFFKFLIAHPLPVHARFGMRRQILVGNAGGENFNLEDAPVEFEVGPLLIRLFRVLLQTTDLSGETPIIFDAVIQKKGEAPAAERWAFPVSFTEDGVLTFGVVLPVNSRPRAFTVFGKEVHFAGAKLGLSLSKTRALIEEDGSAADAFLALVDIEIRPVQTGGNPGPATLQTKTGNNASMYLEDLGWKLGFPTIGSFYDPSKFELTLFKKLSLKIEEIGFVTEDNGGFYVSVSASIEKAFGTSAPPASPPPAPTTPPATPPATPPPDTGHGACGRSTAGRAEAMKRGFGFHLHRLRYRIAGNDEAPRFLLDGASLFVTIGRAELSGFLAMSTFDLPPGNHYEEIAGGIQVCFKALGKTFDLGFQMYRGSVSGVDNFSYWMIGLLLGALPIGSIQLLRIRVIVVENLVPILPPVDGNDQPMRLYRWYKDNLGAVDLPQHRALTAWGPRDRSSAFGAALELAFAGTKAVRFSGFFFMVDSPEEAGFLAGFELYALKAPKPIAFAAFEWDSKRDKWGLTIGFNVGLEALFGNIASWLREITISGLLFFGSEPDTIAIGQYNDTTTWPSIRLNFTRFWKLEVFVGFCYHRVNAADPADPNSESIRVTGAIISAKGSVKFDIGTFKIYFVLSWISGHWRNEAIATGHVLIIEAGVQIRLFGCFNFGASVKADHAVLGPGPVKYRRTSTILRIETPWWLPDVTVRWESISGSPIPEKMEVGSRALVGASAIGPGPRAAIPIGVAGVDAVDPPVVYTLNELRALAAPSTDEDAIAALPLVSCDSEIALDFKVSLDASATILPPTPQDAGLQNSNELSVRYELVSIGIRRRRRYGETAGAWTDLIDPLLTELDSLEDLPPEEWQARFESTVGCDWDADVQRIGRLDPRRLLLNAITPYSFLSSNPEGDETLAGSQPGWPCCIPPKRGTRWHVVDFMDTPAGARTPATERFTQSASTLHWIASRPPVVAPPVVAPPGMLVARVPIEERADGVLAVARFDEPARACEVHAYWSPTAAASQLVIEGYRGLERVIIKIFAMSAPNPAAPIVVEDARGITSVLLRKVSMAAPPAAGPTHATLSGAAATARGVGTAAIIVPRLPASFELTMIRYRTVRDDRQLLIDQLRCQAQDDRIHDGGRLAWLANSDYEVTVRTRAVLGYTRTGEQEGFVEQKAFFRTKGLPGLNAVARIGEELEPYVESVYPPPATTLYRTESVALAFSERFNILAPIDRTPTATDPEERRTMVRWALAIEKVSGDGLVRVSQTSPDWIVEHRSSPLPLPPRRPVLLDLVMTSQVRRAVSVEPLRVRLDRMLTRPGGCNAPGITQHPSQVLVHAPYDPDRPDAAPAKWEAGREYRANLRLEHGPFVDRAPFVAEDAGAFSARTEGGGGGAWTFEDGSMRPPTTAPSGERQYAVFGEADWDHMQIIAGVGADGQAAGIAAGVRLAMSGAVTDAMLAWVDESGPPTLRIELRSDGQSIDNRSAPLPDGTPRPYVLELSVYDDVLRARVAGTEIEAPRGALREGRLAMFAIGGGRITRLSVTALDAYRFHFTGSRYDDFDAHIGSHSGTYGIVRPGDLGAPSTTASALLTETAAEIEAAMAPGADTAARERLFGRWATDLSLPLRSEPKRLEITRYEVGAATDLLIIESPEPLPLGGDVSLAVRKRKPIVRPFPPVVGGGPDAVSGRVRTGRVRPPRAIEIWSAEIDVDLETGRGSAPALPRDLLQAAFLVRAIAAENGGIEYQVFEIHQPRRPGMPLGLFLHEILADAGGDTALLAMAAGEIVLLDGSRRPLITPCFPPPPTFVYIEIPVRTLTDASARRAIVIPVGADPAIHTPLAAGDYRFVFSIDRPRWRSDTPDAASSYRASRTLTASW